MSLYPPFGEPALTWWPELGVGAYPVRQADEPYHCDPSASAYFAKYQEYARTPLGEALTRERVAWVERFAPGCDLVDVGIGCGQFVAARQGTCGYDVNPHGVKWLRERGLWVDLAMAGIAADALSFWDVLEHVEDPNEMLSRARRWVFVSAPEYRGAGHVLSSRHYRRDEHRWYWTAVGLTRWMESLGFIVRGRDDFERRLGREDIWSWAFERNHPAPEVK